MTNNVPLSEMTAKAEALVASLRRQAPAAKMIGEYAVKQGLEMLLQRLNIGNSSNSDSSTKPSVVVVETQSDEEPYVDYNLRTARQIIEALAGLTVNQQRAILKYEQAHRNRVTVVQACQRVLKDVT